MPKIWYIESLPWKTANAQMFFQTGVIGQKRGEWRKTSWEANEKMEALSWETNARVERP